LSSVADKQLEFILVCKPDSHKTLYEWVDDLDRNGVVKTVVRKRWTGKRNEIDTYRYVGHGKVVLHLLISSQQRKSFFVIFR